MLEFEQDIRRLNARLAISESVDTKDLAIDQANYAESLDKAIRELRGPDWDDLINE